VGQESNHSGLVRIFDTFPFDGELDLLEYRLRETFDLVDHFILVEAGETYRGTPKTFTFAENEERFGWARAKIRHVRLAGLGSRTATARERAAVQRNAVRLALADAEPDDVVLLLDVDEVPSRSLLERLRIDGLDRPRRLAMTRHYGFVDTLGPRSPCCPDAADPFPAAAGWSRPGAWDRLESFWHGQSGVAAPARALDGEDQLRRSRERASFPPHLPVELGQAGIGPTAAAFLPRLPFDDYRGRRQHGWHGGMARGGLRACPARRIGGPPRQRLPTLVKIRENRRGKDSFTLPDEHSASAPT
jgi:hypothetical protein